MTGRQRNPFSTCFVEPGKLGYIFESGNIENVCLAFEKNKWRGQIVGPHGSGKTTLCRNIVDHLSAIFGDATFITIRSDGSVSRHLVNLNGPVDLHLFVVDGFERLNWLHRMSLERTCSGKRSGLLLTTHRVVRGLPVVERTDTSWSTFKRIVDTLAKGQLPDKTVRKAFERHQPDIREALMQLYDDFESQTSVDAAS